MTTTSTTRKAAGRVSASVGESRGKNGNPTLETASMLLLGRLPERRSDWDILGRRIGMAGRKEPYSASYMRNMMKGFHNHTTEVSLGIKNLIAELMAEPPDVDYQTITVQVSNGFSVPDGTIIQRDARTCICGVTFIPTAWNQINHTKACAKMRARLKKRTA